MKAPSMTTSGILLVDKSPALTSHDIVARTRKVAGTRKVGHAGTLDPMATGLLVLGLNSSTRLLTFLVGLGKEYFATIKLGETTDSDDADGDVTATADASLVTREAIEQVLGGFVGEIDQVPSSVSAIRINGQRAYDLVRAGEEVELKARRVTISAIEVLGVRLGGATVEVDVRVECSSGTYIRAIARDLGAALAVGGHLTALRRSKVGPFTTDNAVNLGVRDAQPTLTTEELIDHLIAPADVARMLFPELALDEAEVTDLMHGKRIPAGSFVGHDGPIAAIGPGDRLVGLVEARGERVRPIVNFPSDEVRA